MGALKYWIWLSQLTPTAGSQGHHILRHFGSPEAAYVADDEAYELIPKLSSGLKEGLKNKSLLRAEEILEKCLRLNIRVLTLADTEYPERLRQIEDPPCVLYVKGQLPQLDDELAIAVVGARESTPYGEVGARRLAQDLARRGAVIISGIARGIDAAALTGALTGGGRVLSVLGNGIDVVYPQSSESLYEDVAAVGALISEYPPGTRPDGSHFPIRNRIISGLSLGVLVVEGGSRSGSLITARLALEQNREVFALPGNWDAPMSRAPNLLIQRGEAKLVLSCEDILEEYRHAYPHKLQKKEALAEGARRTFAGKRRGKPTPQETEAPVPTPSLPVLDLSQEPESVSDDERVILALIQHQEMTADDIIEASQIPAKRVLSALTMLQVRGLVMESLGKRFTSAVILKGI